MPLDSHRVENQQTTSRREFMGKAAIAGLGAAVILGHSSTVHAAGSDVLKIGLVGCGGRGTGAAEDALNADPNTRLWAVGDVFEDNVTSMLKTFALSGDLKSQIDVAKERQFVGWDAYKQVIDSGVDIVLLCTTPHFRPLHLDYAVKAKKHIFCEKPIAVDATGVRKVIEICKEAQKQNLMMVSGLCYRYEEPKMELMKRIHDGQIGEIKAMNANYQMGGLWHKGSKKNWTPMEAQMRNWIYYTWLSGDHIVEQHIHSLDKAAWAMGDKTPVSCMSSGGRQTRIDPTYGNVFDHFATVYDYDNGVKLFSACRQMNGCDSDVSDYIIGTKGTASCMEHKITGENAWKFPKKKHVNMYKAEHIAFYKALRAGQILNNADYMCKSTMMAIMGRMSAYSGKRITWDAAINSEEDMTPKEYSWGDVSIKSEVAMPGLA
jgi:predicted dehydrogenase